MVAGGVCPTRSPPRCAAPWPSWPCGCQDGSAGVPPGASRGRFWDGVGPPGGDASPVSPHVGEAAAMRRNRGGGLGGRRSSSGSEGPWGSGRAGNRPPLWRGGLGSPGRCPGPPGLGSRECEAGDAGAGGGGVEPSSSDLCPWLRLQLLAGPSPRPGVLDFPGNRAPAPPGSTHRPDFGPPSPRPSRSLSCT